MYKQQKQQYHHHYLTFNKVMLVILLVLISLMLLMSNTSSGINTVMGVVSTGSGSLREWLSSLNDQAHNLQSTSQMLEKAIHVLNSTTEITSNEKSSILVKRTSQLLKIKSALGLINLEIKVIETKCNQFDGPNCDGIVTVPICDSKCKTCTSPSQCTSCYGNFDGVSCSVCKSGWNGLNCTTPICDAKCLNCSSPGQCSVCYGNWNGVTCSTCKSGWNGTYCTTPICDLKCLNCSSPGNCANCSGNFEGLTCSTCKSGWTGSDCNTVEIIYITNSTILTVATQRNRFMNEIMNGVSLQSGLQPKLLFRASNHAFSASAFHSKCDNKGPTITIIKSASGAIFGGYTSKSWTSSGTVSDPSAFMFSLISSAGTERFTKLTQENGYFYRNAYGYTDSVVHNSLNGPTFGGGGDLYIANNANTGTLSTSNLCYNYCLPTMSVGAIAQSYLAGSDRFLVSEYEVYTF